MKKTHKTPKQTLKSIPASAATEQGSLDEFFETETDPREEHATSSVRVILAIALVHDVVPERALERIATPTGTAMVVGVPGADYVEPVAQALTRIGRWGVTYRRTGANKLSDKPSAGSDEAAQVLSAGQNVLGISHLPDLTLPASLVTVADLRIDLRPPSRRVLRSVIFIITGRRPSRIPDDAVRGLSFDEVAACLRRGSRPAECVRRLVAASRSKLRGDTLLADVPLLSATHGYAEAAEWGLRLATSISEWRSNAREWNTISERAVVISGPPGCGKSTFARSLAATLEMPLVATSVSSWFTSGGYLDQVIKAIDAIIAQAVSMSPSVLFIDEIDAIPNRAGLNSRNGNAEYWNTLISHILTRLDSAVSGDTSSLIIVGATNYPERLDEALVRPGRMNRILRIPMPDAPAIAGILRQHLGDDLAGVDLMPLAMLGLGASGAEIASWAKEAREAAWTERRSMVLADLVAQIARPETRSTTEQKAVAIHEAAHSAATLMLDVGTIEGVTIIGRGAFAGRTNVRLRETMALSADEIDAYVVSILCGRAADEHWGTASSGAGGGPGSDLALATRLIAGKHASFGLGGTLAYRGAPDTVWELLDREPAFLAKVELDLQRLHEVAVAFVARHASRIEAIAQLLVRHRVLSGAQVMAVLEDTERPGELNEVRHDKVGGTHG